MVLCAVLFFTVLEAGLRLGGYGYPTAFFIGPDADGIYTSNLQFGWRFFPRSLARTPVPCFLSAKPAGTSASSFSGVRRRRAAGPVVQFWPDPRSPAPRALPGREVRGGQCGDDGDQLARGAGDRPRLRRPSAGPFRRLHGKQRGGRALRPGHRLPAVVAEPEFIRANVWLKSTRVGQLLGDAMGWLRPRKDGSPTAWQGMEMFMGNQVAADDPRLPAVYDNFRQNLIDICGIARRAGAGVILSTVAVNLKDCPPFASQHRSDLSPEELTKWKSLYQAGVELESKEKWPEAIAKYEAAARIDDRFAELPFRLGRCLAALGRSAEARDQFVLARDLDALRFRADSRINAIIREVAAEQEAAGVRLVDAEQSLANSDLAVGGIPGEGLFYEHVHFTFDGNYLLARAFLDEVEAALPQLAASRKQEPILSREQCAESLALTPWDEYQMANLMAEVTSRPPFTISWTMPSVRLRRGSGWKNLAASPARRRPSRRRTRPTRRPWRKRRTTGSAATSWEAGAGKRPPEDGPGTPAGSREAASGRSRVNMDLGDAARSCGRIDEAIAVFGRRWKSIPGW